MFDTTGCCLAIGQCRKILLDEKTNILKKQRSHFEKEGKERCHKVRIVEKIGKWFLSVI